MPDFKAKMHQIQFPHGLCPRTRWRSLQLSPDSLAVFRGSSSKEREGKGRERKGGGKGRDENGLIPPVANFWLYATAVLQM